MTQPLLGYVDTCSHNIHQYSHLCLIINIPRSLSFTHPENPHAMWRHMKAEERWGSEGKRGSQTFSGTFQTEQPIQNWKLITLKNRHKFTCGNPPRSCLQCPQRYQTPKTTARWSINAARLGSTMDRHAIPMGVIKWGIPQI